MQTAPETETDLKYSARLPRKVLRGISLLLWGLAVGEPLANIIGFALPFLGRPMDDLRWLSLLPAAANVIFLFAVFAISCPGVGPERRIYVRVAALWLRGLACLAVINSAAVATAMITGSPYDISVILVFRDVISLIGPTTLFFFLGLCAWEQRSLALGWSMMRLGGIVFVLLALGAFRPRIYRLAGYPGFSDTLESLALSMLVSGCALLIALFGIRRFGRHFARFFQGQCFNCGYPLHGLQVLRCPECGREFTLQELAICRSHLIPRGVMPVP